MRHQVALRSAQQRQRLSDVPADQIPQATQTAIDRVNDLARAARAGWLSLLFVLVFVSVTLVGVEDIDFFIPDRQTALPLVGLSIPTNMFFVLGPPLVAALYGNLHFHLLKL